MEAQVLVGGIMLDSILVGGATSLINLIIHAVLLAGWLGPSGESR
jgi:hypothetical protein